MPTRRMTEMERIQKVERTKERYQISIEEIMSGELIDTLDDLRSKGYSIDSFYWDKGYLAIKIFKESEGD